MGGVRAGLTELLNVNVSVALKDIRKWLCMRAKTAFVSMFGWMGG